MSKPATKSQLMHFDSIYATYLPDTNSSSGVSSSPYRAQFVMNQAFFKVKRVALKSVEIPIGFANIRTGSTDTLKFVSSTVTYTVTLAEKNYTDIATLLADINTACAAVVSKVSPVFSLSTSLTTPMRLLVTTSSLSFRIIDTNLSKYVLGFRADKDSLSSGVYAASTSVYNLNFDNYLLMYIPTLNGLNASMNGGLQSTFKIPLNSVQSQVYYYQESSSFEQHVDITDPNLCFTNLSVIILDRFGKPVAPNGLDYSFTLSVEMAA